jgi:hypothetical protein
MTLLGFQSQAIGTNLIYLHDWSRFLVSHVRFAIGMSVAVCGCAGAEAPQRVEPAPAKDPWLTSDKATEMLLEALGKVEAVAIERWWEVSQSAFLALERRLDASADGWLQIEPDDVFKRCGIKNIEIKPGERLYLIRALYDRPEPDAFELESYGDVVRVVHSTTGHLRPARRTAIVVALPSPPRRVIVNSWSTE